MLVAVAVVVEILLLEELAELEVEVQVVEGMDQQVQVIVNKGGRSNPCTGGEVMTLAKAIQTSVYERFGIRLEPEPVVV